MVINKSNDKAELVQIGAYWLTQITPIVPFFPMYKTHLFSGKIMSNWGVRPIHRYKEKTFFSRVG